MMEFFPAIALLGLQVKQTKIVGMSVLIGLTVSLVFITLWALFERFISLHASVIVEDIQLILWPSSIFLMATCNAGLADRIEIYSISIGVNVLLYSVAGLSFWYGIEKHSWLMGISLGMLLMMIWWRLLTF